MCQIIYHIQNYEKKIHNAKKYRYKRYVVFFSKNLHFSGWVHIPFAIFFSQTFSFSSRHEKLQILSIEIIQISPYLWKHTLSLSKKESLCPVCRFLFSAFLPARLFRSVFVLCIVLFTTDGEEGDDPPPPPLLGELPAGNHLAPPQPPDVTSGGIGSSSVTTTRLRRRMSMRPGSVFGAGGGVGGGGGGTVGNMRPSRSRRPSFQGGGGGGGPGGGGPPQVQLLSIPQLDAIQRSLKLLDVRLQHIQSAAKEDEKTKDNIDHIRRVSSLPNIYSGPI